MYNVNLFDLKDEILKLAEESPDFIYTDQGIPNIAGCSYVGATIGTLGGKACIIGQALQRLGVPEQDLRIWELEADAGTSVYRLLNDNKIITVTGMDDHLMDAIVDTQSAQDDRCPWGRAVIPLKPFAKVTSSV